MVPARPEALFQARRVFEPEVHACRRVGRCVGRGLPEGSEYTNRSGWSESMLADVGFVSIVSVISEPKFRTLCLMLLLLNGTGTSNLKLQPSRSEGFPSGAAHATRRRTHTLFTMPGFRMERQSLDSQRQCGARLSPNTAPSYGQFQVT